MFKQVLKPSDSEGQVLAYEPKTFHAAVPRQAESFMRTEEQEGAARTFEINTLVAQTTGLSDLERKNHQIRVENEVLAKLKEVEERAYKEAYELGLKEGRAKAFEDTKASVDGAVARLAQIIEEMHRIKSDLISVNEKGLIETVFHLAKTIAFKEIKGDASTIRDVLAAALENAQHEEELVIRVNTRDAEYLKSIQSQPGNPLEKLTKFRLDASDRINEGGCLVETNYGVIDATIEQRVAKVWQSLAEKIPAPAEVK